MPLSDSEKAEMKQHIDGMWAKYDVNNSGVLEKAEFETFYNECKSSGGTMSGIPSEHDTCDKVFAFFDKNNNGTVSKDEMVEVIMKIHEDME